ncbi:MAG: 50S ribosomal protein L29 [Xanthomonadales bacterium]|nr:50S ribosomal protein L29 [Xanthomonadales bacterium]NIX13931.1 50S ribosomal protein L29 [Xanthomonadales bacterium]
MDMQDIRAKSEAELREELTHLLQEQFNLRMQRGTGQLTQPHEMRRVRRDIARIKTVLNQIGSGGGEA